jgi:hypothetical protein
LAKGKYLPSVEVCSRCLLQEMMVPTLSLVGIGLSGCDEHGYMKISQGFPAGFATGSPIPLRDDAQATR